MPNPHYTQVVRHVAGVEAKRAVVNAASAAAAGNVLVAEVPGKRICVLAACLIAAGDVAATFYSGPADVGMALSGPLPLGANGGFAIDAPLDANLAWLRNEPGESLVLHLGAAVQVGGWLVYFEEDAE